MTLIGSPEDASGVSVTPKKHRGRIAASPMFPTKMFGRAYLFFFLAAFFFAAILFSSQVSEFFRRIQRRSAYSIHMYSYRRVSCQEESE
jgi:hypothetical protein